jgi:uncharacterized protein
MSLDKMRTFAQNMFRMDAWANAKTGQGTGCDRTLLTKPSLNSLTEDDLENAYRSDDVCARIVDKLPEAAFSKGFYLLPSEDEAHDFFWSEWERLGLEKKFLEAWKWGRLYGDCALILQIDDGQENNQPVNWPAVKEIRWAHVMENRYYDVVSIGSNPSRPYFRQPEMIRVQSHTVSSSTSAITPDQNEPTMLEYHASRVIFFHGKELPWNAYQSNDYSHDSVLQKAWDKISQFDSAYAAVGKLLPELRLRIYKMPGWAEMVASGKQGIVERRLADMNSTLSVYRMLVMDAEESVESDTLTLSGVDAILDKMARRVVQVAEMPHTLVLGEGSQGSTSGRSETEDWATTVLEQQMAYLTPKIKSIIDKMFAQKGAPALPEKGFEIHYHSIISKRDSEKNDEYVKVAQADQIYAMMGVISPEEMRSRFSEDGFQINIKLSEDDDLDGDDVPVVMEQEKIDATDIQALVFNKNRFKNKDQVGVWLKDNSFGISNEVEETENAFRVKQRDVTTFKAGTIRGAQLAQGVTAIVGESR